jgi:iron complex outermembrane receptor protein
MEGADGIPTTDYTKAKLYEAGIAQPRLSASFINSFQYGNFDLNFQLRGVFGNKILNNLRSNLSIPGSILESNMLTAIGDYQTNYSTNQLSDLWLENGSFVRLDNWQIGYNVPAVGGVKNARVYLGGNNLFIITKYKGIDPELEVRGDLRTTGDAANRQRPNTLGLDNTGIYPKTRSFQLGVNLTF